MMELYLDNEKISVPNIKNTKELLEEMHKLLDRVIIRKIYLNGNKIEEKELIKEGLNEISTLKFETKEVSKLIAETLKEAANYLPKLKEGVIDTAGLFSCGEVEEAAVKYQLCIEGIEWYTSVIGKISTLTDNEELIIQNKDLISKLNDELSELMEAFENQDFVLIADLLEYEITEFIDQFIELNNKLYKSALD